MLSPCPGDARCWAKVQRVGDLLVPVQGTALSQVRVKSVIYSRDCNTSVTPEAMAHRPLLEDWEGKEL